MIGLLMTHYRRFQHTAARRRLPDYQTEGDQTTYVSTHSRPKAAAAFKGDSSLNGEVSTHSRPKAAARYCYFRK